MSMTQQKWDAMTGKERADYLKQHEIEVETQRFADGNSKVGEVKILVGRMAVCGGVAITDWMTDEHEAVIASAKEYINSLEQGGSEK